MATEDSGTVNGAEGPLELDLRIEPGEGLSGTVAPRRDRAPATSFSGWLGLAEAIDVLRREAGHPLARRSGPGPPKTRLAVRAIKAPETSSTEPSSPFAQRFDPGRPFRPHVPAPPGRQPSDGPAGLLLDEAWQGETCWRPRLDAR